MAVCKNRKISQEYNPETPYVRTIQNPDSYNLLSPSWCFRTCDKEYWGLNAEDLFIEILPKLKEWEALTWNDILIKAKKKNHSIDTERLNKIARDRLDFLRIEANAVISLRLQGTHRLYGYRIGSVFYILWYDKNHGDNASCICRSRKKHT